MAHRESFVIKTLNPNLTVILIQTAVLKTESDEDEDYYDEEEQPSPPVQ
jgi:hypothetical protein